MASRHIGTPQLRGSGALLPISILALLACAVLLWWMRLSIAYIWTPQTAIDLGDPSAYHLERAVENRFARIAGRPSARGWYTSETLGEFTIVGLQGAPVLVRRATTIDEKRIGQGAVRAAPRAGLFEAQGRLLSRAQAGRYADIFPSYGASTNATVEWLLLDGDRPGPNARTLGAASVLGILALLNLWVISASFQRFFRSRR